MKNNLGVMLIDMQPVLLKDHWKKNKTKMINNQIKVLNHCLEKDIYVVTLEMHKKTYGNTIPELTAITNKIPRHFTLEKYKHDGFSNEMLAKELHKLSIKEVVLMGIRKSCCVEETANGALRNKFKILSSPDVIDNPKGVGKQQNNEIDKWYKKVGIYFPTWEGIINYNIK